VDPSLKSPGVENESVFAEDPSAADFTLDSVVSPFTGDDDTILSKSTARSALRATGNEQEEQEQQKKQGYLPKLFSAFYSHSSLDTVRISKSDILLASHNGAGDPPHFPDKTPSLLRRLLFFPSSGAADAAREESPAPSRSSDEDITEGKGHDATDPEITASHHIKASFDQNHVGTAPKVLNKNMKVTEAVAAVLATGSFSRGYSYS
jgi:hypothetical protein